MENYLTKEEKMIDTPQELIDQTISKVESFLKEISPEYVSYDNGSFTINFGSSQVMIIVRPFTENETCVEIVSNVVTGANITPELMKFLLHKNSEIHFGAFGLLFDDTITFQHSITGTNLDKNEFETSLKAVAIISDYYDDEIINMAGGKRAIDLLSEDFE
jgi:hypothetical protein